MSELHTGNESTSEELITPQAVQTDTGTTESGAELATDTGADQEKPTESEAQQKAMDRAVHQKHKARRETEAANARAEAAEARLDAIEAAKPAPTVSKLYLLSLKLHFLVCVFSINLGFLYLKLKLFVSILDNTLSVSLISLGFL